MKTINKPHNSNSNNNILIKIFNKICIVFSKIIKLLVSLISTLFITLSIIHLVKLMTINNSSTINSIDNSSYNSDQNISNNNVSDNSNRLYTPTRSMIKDLVFNSLLISAFILQHSFMACKFYKSLIRSSSFFFTLERSIYNLFTAISIEFMVENWRYINFLIWDISEYNGLVSSIKKTFIIIALLELVLVLDILELLGLKQVFYYCFKDKEYQLPTQKNFNYYRIMRHPNTISLITLVWLSSTSMSLDLFVLCSFFTFYLLSGNSLRNKDRTYSINNNQLN